MKRIARPKSVKRPFPEKKRADGASARETRQAADLKAFAAEIETLRVELIGQLGPRDVDYIKRVRRISRLAEVLGRALIHLSPDPITWTGGVFSLWLHKQLEAVEIGHSALHGAWDGLADAEAFHSKKFKWDMPIEERSWKRGHNELHHQYTNIAGRDPDLNYGPLRIADQTAWLPQHLVQLALFFVTAPVFPWVINLHMTGLTDLSHPKSSEGFADVLPDRALKTILGAGFQSAKKMVPYFLYNFVFWPALAGPFWWKVLAGNVAADVMRDIYTCATIYAGHFGDDLKYYDSSFKASGRGEWYKAQVEAAHDFEVPALISYLCGALDYQIEHHLFPRLPPNRLRQIRPRIEAICHRYGVQYRRQTWGKTLKGALSRIAKMSIPPVTYLRTLVERRP
ncbi:hypothetical protein F9K50_01150 [bacterium]|nr:MAG: hypothetical protein F9K50_01150 [bacterium]